LLYSVILAGGRGERFWPLSRLGHPKQLLKITSDKTLLQETIDRVKELIPVNRTLVVTGENFAKAILEKVPDLTAKNLILEPEGKNTCVAIALAAVHIKKKDPEAVMAVLSSDHLIEPKERLQKILDIGSSIAKQGDYLITMGVIPTRAETGYGYIELGEAFSSSEGVPVFKVKQFKEKPTRTAAQQYYFDRQHLWNSGIFIWSCSAILKAIKEHMPSLYRELDIYYNHIDTPKEKEERKKLYASAENISIDFAVLEKASNVLTIKADLRWDDIGSWLALERIKEKDRDNNVFVGKVAALDSYETTIVNEEDGIVAALGVSDLVIVHTDGIVFVAHKTKVQDVKELLQKLASDKDLEKYL